MSEQITRERAIEIVEECEKGLLMVGEVEPIPVIGELSEDDKHKVNVVVNAYEFGNEDIDLTKA